MPIPLFLNRRAETGRIVVLSLAVAAPWLPGAMLPATLEAHGELHQLLSFMLVLCAVFGRVWTLMFVGGRKDRELCTVGPYSLVRHPLYLFTLLGVIGIAVQTHHPIVGPALPLIWLLTYPFTMRREERRLAELFGARFLHYRWRVPALWPRWRGYVAPPTLQVSTSAVRRALLDNLWWLVIWYWLGAVERARITGWWT